MLKHSPPLLNPLRLSDLDSFTSAAAGPRRIDNTRGIRRTIRHGTPAEEIISMGLGKTGTTATANALFSVGYRVAHNQGDRLSLSCHVIINTMESEFEALDRHHPRAKWILTYSENAKSWLASVNSHIGRYNCRAEERNCTVLLCRFYGCDIGLPPGANGARTHIRLANVTRGDSRAKVLRVNPEDETALLAAYRRYYARLFRYFAWRPYALVDVRAGKYVNLPFIHSNLTAPFSPYNTKARPGGYRYCSR